MNRPETGPLQFDGDWAGVFIRGDRAIPFSCTLDSVMEQLHALENLENYGLLSIEDWNNLEELQQLLIQCHQQSEDCYPPQKLKSFKECKKE